jgi:succinate dehydrogenase / fumarate reductase, flavoprotein subunit
MRRCFAREQQETTRTSSRCGGGARGAGAVRARAGGENPYQIQQDLQQLMQDLVGIVRREEEMQRALERMRALQQRAQHTHVPGNREYNPGWHTALDLENLLTVSEAITRAALERRESRGGHFRDDFPGKDERYGRLQRVRAEGARRRDDIRREPIPRCAPSWRHIVEEMK